MTEATESSTVRIRLGTRDQPGARRSLTVLWPPGYRARCLGRETEDVERALDRCREALLSGRASAMDGSRASEVFEPAKGCVNGSSPAGREPSFRPADCGGGGRSVKTRSRVPARR